MELFYPPSFDFEALPPNAMRVYAGVSLFKAQDKIGHVIT